jgi:hypothetical protein
VLAARILQLLALAAPAAFTQAAPAAFAQPAPAAPGQEDALEIVRRAFARDENIFDAARDYTYLRAVVEKELDSKGKVRKTESETSEALIFHGRAFYRLLERNGKPLSGEEERKEREKLDRAVAKHKREVERGKASESRAISERRRAAREIPEAFDFRLTGVENIAGRPAWAIAATPKPGYRPRTRQGGIYSRMSGALWIDQAESRVVRVDAHVNDTISVGWFLFRLKPGSRFVFEQAKIGSDVWLPSMARMRGEAKIGMLKTIRGEYEVSYSDYKKFSSDSRVVSAGEPE